MVLVYYQYAAPPGLSFLPSQTYKRYPVDRCVPYTLHPIPYAPPPHSLFRISSPVFCGCDGFVSQ